MGEYFKDVVLFHIPKFLGNIFYFLISIILLMAFTAMVFMGLIEMTYSNNRMWMYFGLSVVVVILFIVNVLLLERVEFLNKVIEFDASIGIFHRTKGNVKKASMTKQEFINKWVTYVVVLIVMTMLIIGLFLYVFAVIFTEGDLSKITESFF